MELPRAYQLLEVKAGAESAEVRAAYRRLAWRWHPDRWQADPALARRGAEELAQINAAYAAIRRAGFPAAAPARRPAEPAWASCPPPASAHHQAPGWASAHHRAPGWAPVPARAPSPAPARGASARGDEDDESVLWALVWLVLVVLTFGALAELAEVGQLDDD